MKTQRRRSSEGLFISFEGIEGCGKSTQARLLAEHLRAQGYMTVETREPGGTPLAEKVRTVLLDRWGERIAPETEAFLIFAARRQHVAQVIQPALAKRAIVLCDRFSDSTLAYQGYARGLGISTLRSLNRLATDGVTPDVTFVFDLPVAKGLARRRSSTEQNRLDRETLQFHEKVRAGFLDLAQQDPRRIKVIPAEEAQEKVARIVALTLTPILDDYHSFLTLDSPQRHKGPTPAPRTRHALR
jgi:dTMP kinase